LPRPDTVNSSNLLRTYYRLFRQLWENTRENGLRPVQKSIRLFDEQIELIFTDERLLSFIMPALEHLSIAAQGNPSLKIYIGDDTTTNAVMPPPPWMEFGVQGVAGAIEGVFTHRGDVRGFTHDRIKTAFNWSANALSIYDPDEAVAFYWTRDARDLPAYETSAPLRTILNWWVQRRNGHFMHGAVVGTTTGGVLLAGKGGSGKSTAALAALKEGLYYVSDDYCLIALQPEPAAYCVFSSAKVDPENLFRIPQIVSRRGNSGNPYDDKEVFFLYPQFAEQIVPRLPLRAILLPRVTGRRESRLLPASIADSIKALTISTICQFPGAGKQAVEFILSLVKQLPSYYFEFGTDLSVASEVITDLLGNVRQ